MNIANKFIQFITVLLLFISIDVSAQTKAIKSSATMLALGTLNFDYNFSLNNNITCHLPISYNPFVFQDGRFQQITFQPGIRLWLEKKYTNGYFSLYGIASRYHVGGIFGMKYRYDGNCYGMGIGTGYSWILSKRFNLDTEIGAGLVYTNYEKCGYKRNDRKLDEYKGIRLIPSKLDISLIYFF